MEKLTPNIPTLTASALNGDEYIKGGLIYCKNCNTPRQKSLNWGGELKTFSTRCDCQQKRFKAEEKENARQEREQKINVLRQCAIPNPAYRNYTFKADDGKTPRTTEICKNYINKFNEFQKFGGGLLLWGSVGTGKTFYAMCIANALVDKEINAYCTTLAEVVKKAQDFDRADAHFARLMAKEIIIIDDLGTERGTTFAHEQIYKFIDGCNTRNIPLIFTTNYSPDILQKATEDTVDLVYARIYSRILEKCTPIAVLDVKRRAENQKANYNQAAALLGLK
jgi:DNA replication protein DnaC